MVKMVACLVILSILAASSIIGVVLPRGDWAKSTCKIVKDASSTVDTIGTGFILRYKDETFIVTNKHVVTPGKSRFNIGVNGLPDTIVMDPQKGGAIPEADDYFEDPLYDLAFVHITRFVGQQLTYTLNVVDNSGEIKDSTRLTYTLDIACIPQPMIGDDTMIVAGREVFFLGYPSGLAGYNPRVPLVRGGIIAGEFEHQFLLDGNVFGGSSGSPVFLDIDAENRVVTQKLVGIISEMWTAPARLGIINKTASPETSTEKLPTETQKGTIVKENIGIGIAIKVNYIIKTIENWMQSRDK